MSILLKKKIVGNIFYKYRKYRVLSFSTKKIGSQYDIIWKWIVYKYNI